MTFSVGNYLFERLKQLNVDSIFGVPGDFNLALLDYINDVKGLKWVGNTNELNAGYAADGYSRVKRLACLITTFGVGELSALAAVAGSYAEHVGLLHVVGVPSTGQQNQHLLLHHTLGNGDFTAFKQMSEKISHTATTVLDAANAPEQIDNALRAACIYQRPVYLALPTNIASAECDSTRLKSPLNLQLEPNEPEAEEEVLEAVIHMIGKAKRPIILVDACCSRHDVIKESLEVARITQFPIFVTPMGKSVVDEHNPRFGGVYVGSLTDPDVAETVEGSDLVLSIGGLMSDFNTGSFSYHLSTKDIVEFHSDHIKIKRAVYPGIQMKFVLDKLSKRLEQHPVKKELIPVTSVKTSLTPIPPHSPIRQQWLWTRVGQWLRPGDIIVTETGTSSFGIIQTKFPKNTIGISQVLWGSIGYSVGATMGASMAAAELDPERRVILFVGDGSLQLTVTEISTMIKWGLKPYIFVLNNDGYTIERLIHGPEASYNNIPMWKYTKLLEVFGAKDYESPTVETVGDLDRLYNNKEFSSPSKIRLVEIILPKMDAPINLVKQAELTARNNAAVNKVED
jgi:pyruvate decarboxylase